MQGKVRFLLAVLAVLSCFPAWGADKPSFEVNATVEVLSATRQFLDWEVKAGGADQPPLIVGKQSSYRVTDGLVQIKNIADLTPAQNDLSSGNGGKIRPNYFQHYIQANAKLLPVSFRLLEDSKVLSQLESVANSPKVELNQRLVLQGKLVAFSSDVHGAPVICFKHEDFENTAPWKVASLWPAKVSPGLEKHIQNTCADWGPGISRLDQVMNSVQMYFSSNAGDQISEADLRFKKGMESLRKTMPKALRSDLELLLTDLHPTMSAYKQIRDRIMVWGMTH